LGRTSQTTREDYRHLHGKPRWANLQRQDRQSLLYHHLCRTSAGGPCHQCQHHHPCGASKSPEHHSPPSLVPAGILFLMPLKPSIPKGPLSHQDFRNKGQEASPIQTPGLLPAQGILRWEPVRPVRKKACRCPTRLRSLPWRKQHGAAHGHLPTS
jgi:hypothetical protein